MDKDKYNVRTKGPIIGQCVGDNQHVSMSFEQAKEAHGIADRNFIIPWELATKLSKDKWFQMCRELQAIVDKYEKEDK